MRRTFWFGAGVASAIYLSRKVRRATDRVMPAGLADQMFAWREGLRAFVGDVRAGAAEHESELRETFERSDPARPQPVLPSRSAPRAYPDVA